LGPMVGCKPRQLTQANAAAVIPNGMSEAEVYEILGTNGNVATGAHGEKMVMYFFPFTGKPPQIETKLPLMTVVFSNAAVIERRFPE
jgi:hypothetical protein